MVDQGPFTWASIQLSKERVIFDTSCLECASETHGVYVCTAKGSVVQIERDGHLRALVNQGSFQFLAAECVRRNIDTEFAGISNSSSCARGYLCVTSMSKACVE